jgi:hypothetical protein
MSEIQALADVHYDPGDIAAPLASGSYPTRGMIVAPCSIKTLSAIANCYTSDLITRAADVCLKEGRPVVLMVREAPPHRGHIRLMDLTHRPAQSSSPPSRRSMGAADPRRDGHRHRWARAAPPGHRQSGLRALGGVVGVAAMRASSGGPPPQWRPGRGRPPEGLREYLQRVAAT